MGSVYSNVLWSSAVARLVWANPQVRQVVGGQCELGVAENCELGKRTCGVPGGVAYVPSIFLWRLQCPSSVARACTTQQTKAARR